MFVYMIVRHLVVSEAHYSNKFTSRAFIVYKQAIKDTQPSCCLSESGIELSYIPLYLLIEFD